MLIDELVNIASKDLDEKIPNWYEYISKAPVFDMNKSGCCIMGLITSEEISTTSSFLPSLNYKERDVVLSTYCNDVGTIQKLWEEEVNKRVNAN